MTQERIDIQITDTGADKAAKSLREIAAEARKSGDYVERLKASLASLPASRLRAATTGGAASRASDDLGAARNTSQLARAKDAAAAASRRHAAALEAEAARTERLRAVAEKASQAQALPRASGWAGGGNPFQAQADAAQAAVAAAQRVRDAQQTANAAGAAFEQQTISRFQRIKMATLSAYDSTRDAMRHWFSIGPRSDAAATGLDKLAGSTTKAGNAAKLAGHHQANLVAQLNDIGVSLASGQNPFIVLLQQGSQLQDLSMRVDGGFKTLALSVGNLLMRFLPLVAVLGGAYLGFKNFTDEIKGRAQPALDSYVDSLGLTSDEVKRLAEDSGGLSITMGDSWNGFVATVREGLSWFIEGWNALGDFVAPYWDKLMGFLRNAFLGFYAAVYTLIEVLGKTFINVFKIAANVIVGVFNAIVLFVENKVNSVIDGLNLLGSAANGVLSALGFEGAIPAIDKLNLGVKGITQNMYELESVDIGATFAGRVNEADRTLRGFAQRWEENTRKAAEDRIGAAYENIIGDRAGGSPQAARAAKDPQAEAAEKRAAALNQVNVQLDNEIARMRLLKDARAIEQRMDQITESLLQKKIVLNREEAASIRAKVTEIERFKFVQAELDRITDEAIGPERTLNSVREAGKMLLDQGVISAERYGMEIGKANLALQQAINPLFQFNEQLAVGERTMGLYGEALEQANYLETIRQALVAQGYEGDALRQKLLSAEVQDLLTRNQALRDEAFIRSQLGAIVNPIVDQQREIDAKAALYAELDRLRQADLISEDAYQRARAALWVKYNEMKLQNTATFFGTLASITAEGHGAVGAISKAAAVAEATIQGYLATQKALASAPPPWNFVAAAAVALQTGANVAKILSTNVGSFNTGGQFMVRGRGGVDQNNINMNVSRGERVTIETAKQQRENDSAGGGTVVNSNTKVVNMFDEREFISAMDSEEGEEVVMNIIRRRKSDAAGLLGLG